MPQPQIGHKRCLWPSVPLRDCEVPECPDNEAGDWHEHCFKCGKRREAEDRAEELFLKPIKPQT